jgi:Domain of unknown function (DUF5658)
MKQKPVVRNWLMGLFVLLSALDLLLTGWLLSSRPGEVYESNPVARWWLARHGWPGLAAYKAATVALFAAALALLYRRRPAVARRVLQVGCLTVAAVVAYSGALAATVPHAAPDGELLLDLADVESEERREHTRRYHAAVRELSDDVLAGRRELTEAAGLLEESFPSPSPGAFGRAPVPPGVVIESRARRDLLRYTLARLEEDPEAQEEFLRSVAGGNGGRRLVPRITMTRGSR